VRSRSLMQYGPSLAPSRWSSGPGTTLVLELDGDGGCDGEHDA
jgi:hypothetical protein